MKLWAVEKDGVIDGRTVYNSIRGAKVNWLWINGVRVMNGWSDNDIFNAFLGYASEGVKCIEIEVTKDVSDVDA
jgi:hypothetical protein